MVEKTIQTMTIEDYLSRKYLVNIEEPTQDIWWIIKYEDDANDYIVVCTKDQRIFAYGWHGYNNYFNTVRELELFATPMPLTRSRVVNDIVDDVVHFTEHYDNPRPLFYQARFNTLMNTLSRLCETGYEYDLKRFKKSVMNYLKIYGIDTPENIQKIEQAQWTSKQILGCRGIIAKEDWTNRQGFCCQAMNSVWHEGEWHDTWYSYDYDRGDDVVHIYRNIPFKGNDLDDWGERLYVFDFDDIKSCLR